MAKKKNRHKEKSKLGNSPDSKINLVTALINLIIAVVNIIAMIKLNE